MFDSSSLRPPPGPHHPLLTACMPTGGWTAQALSQDNAEWPLNATIRGALSILAAQPGRAANLGQRHAHHHVLLDGSAGRERVQLPPHGRRLGAHIRPAATHRGRLLRRALHLLGQLLQLRRGANEQWMSCSRSSRCACAGGWRLSTTRRSPTSGWRAGWQANMGEASSVARRALQLPMHCTLLHCCRSAAAAEDAAPPACL